MAIVNRSWRLGAEVLLAASVATFPARAAEPAAANGDFVIKSDAMDDDAAGQDDGRTLPNANGRRFDTLDEYLKHLEQYGAVGLPYYREVRPGLYELVSNYRALDQGQPEPRLYSRRELMRMFGFTR